MSTAAIVIRFVSSITVITLTSDESLSSETKSFVIGGSASRSACGSSTWRSVCVGAHAERARRLGLAARDREQRAAIDLGLVRAVVEAEAEDRGLHRAEAVVRREAVVEDEQLQQHRRAAEQLDVDARERARRPAPP